MLSREPSVSNVLFRSEELMANSRIVEVSLAQSAEHFNHDKA
jgi:hypothetical protein